MARPSIARLKAVSTTIGIAVLLLAAPAGNAARPDRTLATFDVPGTYSWTVPAGVSQVTFDVLGAQGGGDLHGVAVGGAGGEARATFAVRAGQTFQITIGGRGSPPCGSCNGGFGGAGPGGFNGGGNGGGVNASGGGGASDVRLGGGDECGTTRSCGPQDRIIVGGGGGGAASRVDFVSVYNDGGDAGGFVGFQGDPAVFGEGSGGNGGAHFWGTVFFGFGGNGQSSGGPTGGGGGGSGWFGGVGGGVNAGGGGGSGFFHGLATNGSFPGGFRVGDGLVIVTEAARR